MRESGSLSGNMVGDDVVSQGRPRSAANPGLESGSPFRRTMQTSANVYFCSFIIDFGPIPGNLRRCRSREISLNPWGNRATVGRNHPTSSMLPQFNSPARGPPTCQSLARHGSFGYINESHSEFGKMAHHETGLGTTMPSHDGKYTQHQIDAFQSEDRAAGRAVILLMSGVFTIGLIMASTVCWACWPQ